MKSGISPELRKEIREYFQYHGGSAARAVKWVHDPEGDALLLVRFTDEDEDPMSALVFANELAGGEWEISEEETINREEEHAMVREFEQGIMDAPIGWQNDDDWDDDDDPYSDDRLIRSQFLMDDETNSLY